MTEIPSGRKKLGIAAIVTTALVALPVTASISYAQEEAPEVPAAPLPPAAPEAPEAPTPPEAPSIETIDPDNAHRIVRVRVDHEGEDGEGRRRMVVRRFGPDGEFGVEDHEFPSKEEMERMFAELESEMAELDGLDEHIELALVEARRAMNDANHNVVILRSQREALADAHARSAEARERGERARVMALEHAQHAREMALRNMPDFDFDFEFNCDGNELVQNRETEDGRRVMVICRTAGQNMALNALRQAQRTIRHSPGLAEDERERIVEELQEEIERMEERTDEEEVSFAPKVEFRASKPLQPVVRAPQVIRTSAVSFDMREEAGKSAKEDCGEEIVSTLPV